MSLQKLNAALAENTPTPDDLVEGPYGPVSQLGSGSRWHTAGGLLTWLDDHVPSPLK